MNTNTGGYKKIGRHKETEFKKGVSGNPKGRTPKLPELDVLLSKVLSEESGNVSAAEAILKALRLKAIKGDVRAIEVILNRAYGKEKSFLEITGKQGRDLMPYNPTLPNPQKFSIEITPPYVGKDVSSSNNSGQ